MRVAVHHPDSSISAFRLGRIEDFTNPITAETTPKEQVAAKLLADAQAEYPDCEIVLERLVDNGDGTSTWVHHEQVPDGALSPGGSVISHVDLRIEQPQEAS